MSRTSWPMHGRIVLVTGAANGLGRATALALGQAGAIVLVHARTQERAGAAVRELAGDVAATDAQYVPVWADLGSVAGARFLADQVTAVAPGGLHVLVNNAGSAFAHRALSPDGVERTLAVNHVAVAAVTSALLSALRLGAGAAGRPSRVVNVSSTVERWGNPELVDWTYPDRYRQWQAYCDSKLLNLAYTYALASELDGSGVSVIAANPGNVATGFGRNGGIFKMVQWAGRFLLASPAKGARTSIRLASDPALDGSTGGYFSSAAPAISSAASRDPDFGRRVYDRTTSIVARALR